MSFNTSETVTPVSELTADLADTQGRAMPVDVISQILPLTIYRRGASSNVLPLGDTIWSNLRRIYYSQNDYSVAGAGLPELPSVPLPVLEYIYTYLTQNTANSMGTNDITDIPTSWRNGVAVVRVNLERNELTNAQQVKMVGEIEREINAGMSSSNTSTSTAIRVIDFGNTSSFANDSLVQADLVALGWNSVNATSMSKVINGFTWRVLHNS